MTICRRITSIVLAVILLVCTLCVATPVHAASVSIKLDATCRYDYAFEVLNQVNKYRKDAGLSALKMNTTLLNNAMQRAAEIAVRYDHIRPDGTECFSINSNIAGENITLTYATPEKAMESWMKSAPHKANILSKDYKTMGVGTIIHNGEYYWVQVFSKKSLTATTTVPENTDKTFTVSLGSKKYTLSLSIPSKVFITDVVDMDVIGKNASANSYFAIDGDNFTWKSSNASAVSVSSKTATALAEGSATITASGTVGSVSSKVTVSEFGKGKSHQCGDAITWEYNNKTLTFTGEGAMYDYNAECTNTELISTDVPWADGLTHVEKIVVGEGITSIGNGAFAGFEALTDIKLPSTLEHIGDKAFAHCYTLTSVTIPDSVTTIGSEAFLKCLAMTDIKLSENLTAISSKMLYTCNALVSVNVPNSVERIEKNAFGYCRGMTDITLPQNLTFIDEYGFYGCESLTEITIPYVVASINKKTFNDCKALKKITVLNPTAVFSGEELLLNVPSGLTIYGYADSSAQTFCTKKGIKFIALSTTDIEVEAQGYTAVYTGEPVTKDIAVTVRNVPTQEGYAVRFSKGESFDHTTCCDSISSLGEYWRTHKDYYSKLPDYLKELGTYPISYCVYGNGATPVYGTVYIKIDKYPVGDVDRDTKVSILDATAIQMAQALLITFDDEQKSLGDFDGDSKVTVMDATAIQMHLAGLR